MERCGLYRCISGRNGAIRLKSQEAKRLKSIAVYYRVSTDKQDLSSQEQAIAQWLASLPPDKKPINIAVFKDEGLSGSVINRPGFQAMLHAAKAKQVDTIVCFRLDRFSRDASSAIRLILDLDDMGVGFVSVTQPILNLGHENPFRRTILAAFAEISQLEREAIVSRIKAGLQAARERGSVIGRPRHLPPDTIDKVLKHRRTGMAYNKIAKKLRISVGYVFEICKQRLSEEERNPLLTIEAPDKPIKQPEPEVEKEEAPERSAELQKMFEELL
jgi:DNA invertase Pin-like site-specific DNA recombinase